jgi:hypothetical protein
MDYQAAKEVLKATRSTLKQVEEQLDFFERKRAEAYAEYLERGSRNQKYFYRSDANGLVQLDNDAAFVVEQLFCFPYPLGNDLLDIPLPWRFSLRDRSSGRDLTEVFNRVPATSDEAVPIEMLSPSWQIVPYFQDQDDYWFYLPSQYLLPRASVLEFRVSNLASATSVLLPEFVLGGHKIY